MLRHVMTLGLLSLTILMFDIAFANEKISTFSNTAEIQQFNFPGGVIQLNVEKQSDDLPDVKYGLSEPAIMDRGKHWRIILGVGLDTLPGEYVVYVKHDIKGIPGLHNKVLVRHINYPYVEAKPKQNSQYQGVFSEYDSLSSIDFSNTQQPSFPLRHPLQGEWSNYFGHSIKVNAKQTLIRPNAVSLVTTKLASVRSPQNAIVSKIETTKDGLQRVFLDHGRGVYSIISGLSDLTIEVSNGIVAGAVIGKLPSGKSQTTEADFNTTMNRSIKNRKPNISGINSKRLIWQTVMNGEYVNPLILTQLAP